MNYSFEILDIYFIKNNYNVINGHHINSFNDCISNDLPKIIKQFNPIVQKDTKNNSLKTIICELEFDNISIIKPEHMNINRNSKKTFPNHCRNDNSKTYSISIKLDYILNIFERNNIGQKKLLRKIKSKEPMLLGKIPVMIRSKFCNLHGLSQNQLKSINEDPEENGGYFIVQGMEYIIIPQENKINNYVYKNKETDGSYKVWGSFKTPNTYNYPYFTTVYIDTHDKIYISVSVSIKTSMRIPLSIFYKALGICNDKKIYDYIIGDKDDNNLSNILIMSLSGIKNSKKKKKNIGITYNKYEKENEYIKTKRDAMLYIGKILKTSLYHKKGSEISNNKLIEYVESKIFDQELFPMLGGSEKSYEKALYLSKMVRSCIRLRLGLEKPYDIYGLNNKMIKLPGILYCEALRHTYNDYAIKNLRDILRKLADSYNQFSQYDTVIEDQYNNKIMDKLESMISTGEWPAGRRKNFNVKAGVSQLLERRSKLDTCSFSQKIVITGKSKGGRDTIPLNARHVHSTQFGRECPYDTPCSNSIGKHKNKTYYTHISNYIDHTIIIKHIEYNYKDIIIPINKVSYKNAHSFSQVIVNGIPCCYVDKHKLKDLHNNLIIDRRKNIINRYISIVLDMNDYVIKIMSHSGRFLRPLFIVKNGKINLTKELVNDIKNKKATWNDLLESQAIEFINTSEEYHGVKVALDTDILKNNNYLENYTHCELNSTIMNSIISVSTANSDKSQPQRNTFGCQLIKQAAGVYASNYQSRMDTDGSILGSLHKPIVSSRIEKYVGMYDLPGGQNVITAIIPSKFNIEDSTVVNKRSIEQGLLYVTKYKTNMDVITSGTEKFMKPNPEETKNYNVNSSYSAIDQNGLAIVGKKIEYDDIIIGKCKQIPKNNFKNNKYRFIDKSKKYKQITPGIIEKVVSNKDDNKRHLYKIKVRIPKELKVGDKIATRSAQKSTVSADYNSYDMSYIANSGIVPSINFGPHGMVTRMTINLIHNSALGIIGTNKGIRIDGTPFQNYDVRSTINDELIKLGYKNLGKRKMINGITGKYITNEIYVAPIYYQRLKHMVTEKISARNIGSYSPNTRQPTQGRSKNGGFKISHMGGDALKAHGAEYMYQEKMTKDSDGHKFFISKNTGNICVGNTEEGHYKDKSKNIKINQTYMPFGLHRIIGHIKSIGVNVKLNTKDV